MSSTMARRYRRSGKGVELPKPPRELQVIEKEYQQACFQAGSVQYQIAIYERELENLNQKILDLNQEAAKRKDLDKLEETKKEEVKGA